MHILAGEYVDFADLPPAKGKVKSLPAPEGSVIIVQAYDLLQQKWLIPDLATLMQCSCHIPDCNLFPITGLPK